MKEIDKYHTVAKAVRVEYESNSDKIYIVFEIIDEKFKKKVKDEWHKDMPLRLIDKKLAEFKEEN